MKFGDQLLDSAYQGVIQPLGAEFGYQVLRMDEIQDSGNITSQILENIASSKIVLVELSGERSNCYYEAGYAHALGKEIIFCIKADIEQPLPRRNLIYLAYFLPKELENFSSEVCEARNAHCDVSVHRQGHAIDALQELAYPAQGRSRRRWPDLVGP